MRFAGVEDIKAAAPKSPSDGSLIMSAAGAVSPMLWRRLNANSIRLRTQMPANPTYNGPAKVRVVAPGVSGEEMRLFNAGRRPVNPPSGYELVWKVSKRTGMRKTQLYAKLRYGRIPGAKRVGPVWFIPKDWTPGKLKGGSK